MPAGSPSPRSRSSRPWRTGGRGAVGRHARGIALASLAILAPLACGGTAGDEGASGGTAALPAPCEYDGSPYVQDGCLPALRRACNELDSETACAAHEPFVFEGDEVACAWAKVVRFSDPASCGGAEVYGRCEPKSLVWSPCESYCSNPVAEPPASTDMSADAEAGEIVFLCNGPLDESSMVEGGDRPGLRSCAAGGEPPPPDLCQCGPQACEATP